MSAKFIVDFFQVSTPEDANVTVRSLFEKIHRLPKEQRFYEITNDALIWLLQLKEYDGKLEGNMVRSRMDVLPKKGKPGGDTKSLDLDDDEGVTDESAFIFDPSSNMLGLQRHRSGVSRKAIGIYLQEKGELDGPLLLDPALKTDALRQLDQMDNETKVSIRLAAPVDPSQLVTPSSSAAGFIDTVKYLHAPKATLELSVGRAGGALRRVKEFARLCLRENQKEISFSSVSVVGDIDGERTELDLIKNTVCDIAKIETSERRTLPYPTRRIALREAWERQKEELRTYGVKG